MKKSLTILALAIVIISCDKSKNTAVIAKEFKTAYIDTNKLLEASTEAKDLKDKYEKIADQKDNQIKAEATRLEAEKKGFEANAQKNGQAWAQQKYGELQQKSQQLQMQQQQIVQDLQTKHGVEMDSLVSRFKKVFKEYGKSKGYDYIYGTGESATVLYAKDNYDITKDIIKLINDKYTSGDKKEEKSNKKK